MQGWRSGCQDRGFAYVAARGRGSGPLAHAAAAWAGNALLLDAYTGHGACAAALLGDR
jgi:hypothetical protein